MVAQVTGGDPRTTGIYYDDSYNRELLPPGSACAPGQTTGLGTEVNFAENIDRNLLSIDARFGIPNLYPGLPSSVLGLPGDVPSIEAGMIDPAQLPIDPKTCAPVYPRQYLRVNTVFQVAHNAGMRTHGRTSTPPTSCWPGTPAPASTTCSPPRSTARPPTRSIRRPER
jgi:hypothetical protein